MKIKCLLQKWAQNQNKLSNGHPLSLRSKTDFVSFRPKEYV